MRGNTVYAVVGRDVDGSASHGATRHGEVHYTCTGLSSDSGSGGLVCTRATGAASDAAERRLADGIYRPPAPQLRGAHADDAYDSLAALKRWVHRLEATEDLLGDTTILKEEACWVSDSEDEGATPRIRCHWLDKEVEPRREARLPATMKAPPY